MSRGGGGLPLPARLLIVLVIAGGGAALAWRLPAVRGWGGGELLSVLAIAVAIAVLDEFTLALPHDTETEYFSVNDSVWTAALLLASGSVVTIAVAAGTLAGQAIHRWPPHKIAFNVGQVVVSLTAATEIYRVLGSPPPSEPRAWAVAAAAMAAAFVVNAGTVALVIALVQGESVLRVVLAPMRVNVLQLAGNVGVGILAALVWETSRAGVLLLLLPLGLLYLAYRGWLRSLRERDQMKEIAKSADGIARAGDLGTRLPVDEEDDPLGVLTTTLNRMLERLEAAFLRERRFIREASHELRTPLTISRGHLEVLGPDLDPAELRQTIGLLLDEFDRMGRILEEMTTLARSEQPGFLRPTEIQLGPLLADVAAKAAPLLEGRLRTSLPTNGALVWADPQRLTQAFLNLLLNAAVHAPGNGAVDLRAVPEPAFWRIEVADRGGGVPAGEEEAVFRPFYQASNARSGSGLGLALVRTIAAAHGGSAGVDSRPGAGATFWVRVPR